MLLVERYASWYVAINDVFSNTLACKDLNRKHEAIINSSSFVDYHTIDQLIQKLFSYFLEEVNLKHTSSLEDISWRQVDPSKSRMSSPIK